MRRVLVDHARARKAEKRGGSAAPVPLEGIEISMPESDEQLIALDDALTRLAEINPRQSRVVELRYFAGLKEEEVANLLGVARRTVNRDWQMARAWLYGQVSKGDQ